MTYTSLTGSTLVSDLATTLNGVTTRVVPITLSAGQGATSVGNSGGSSVRGWEIATGQSVSFVVPVPERADVALGATLRVLFAPSTAEASKQVEFTADVFEVPASSTAGVSLAGTATESADTGDVDCPESISYARSAAITLTSGIWSSASGGFLAGEITRTAPSGTDLTGDVFLVAASLTYTIER